VALIDQEMRTSTPTRVGVLAGVIVAGTVAGILRQPGPGALNTIWAEDGQVFLTQATRDGAGAFGTSYAGYYHLVARLIGAVAAALPASWAAAVLAIGASLVTTIFAVAAYELSGEYLPSRLGRLIISVPVAVLPMAMGDVLNSPANLHWTGLYVLFWFLVCRPTSRTGKALVVLGIVLVAGSDILAGIYLPLAAFIIWFHRDRYAVVKAVAFGVPLLLQVLGLLTGQSEREGLAPDPVRGVTGYLLRAVPTAFFGERWVGLRVGALSLVFTALALMLIAGALFLAWRRFTTPRWWFALAAIVHSVGLYVGPVALSGVATPRYNVAPALLLLVAVVALILPKDQNIAISVLAVLLAIVCLVNFRVANDRSRGPAWQDGLDSARVTCATDRDGTVTIELPPLAAPGWHAVLPCDYVDRN